MNPRHIPRRSGAGSRQVLIPGTKKAVPHSLSIAATVARRQAESEAAR